MRRLRPATTVGCNAKKTNTKYWLLLDISDTLYHISNTHYPIILLHIPTSPKHYLSFFLVFRLKFSMYFSFLPAVLIAPTLQRNISIHSNAAELSVSLRRQPLPPVHFKCPGTINVRCTRRYTSQRVATFHSSGVITVLMTLVWTAHRTAALCVHAPPAAPCSLTPRAPNTPPPTHRALWHPHTKHRDIIHA